MKHIIKSFIIGLAVIFFTLNTIFAQQRSSRPQILTYQESQNAVQALKRSYTIVDQCGDYNLFVVAGKTNSGKAIRKVVNRSGVEVIPDTRDYDSINFEDENGYEYFKVRFGSYYGVCNLDGKEIISPNNRISFIYFSQEEGYIGYFKVEAKYGDNYYDGAYDIYGKEIIKPILFKKIFFDEGRFWSSENGEYLPLIYGLNRKGQGIMLK